MGEPEGPECVAAGVWGGKYIHHYTHKSEKNTCKSWNKKQYSHYKYTYELWASLGVIPKCLDLQDPSNGGISVDPPTDPDILQVATF